jgi:hypothetical protein
VDFLVERKKGKLLGHYSAPQSLALAAEVTHRFWEISGWEDGKVPVPRRIDVE